MSEQTGPRTLTGALALARRHSAAACTHQIMRKMTMTQATAHAAPGTGPQTLNEEPLPERVWRQVEASRIDEERLLPSAEKH